MLGRVLLIANPTAQNSAAGEAIDVAAGLVSVLPGCESLEVATTNAPGHAKDIASKAQGFDTFVALGGDGLVHEVCNGIMMRDGVAVRSDAARIQMGLIPFGSGNDYARTLGMSTDLKTAAVQLAEARPAMLDVGVCNGEYFCETLSFGLDAAIALDTVERRKRIGKTGTQLYLASGIDQLLHHLDIHTATVRFDDLPPQTVDMHLLAVQIGRTYGGGFAVCPEADAQDGLFDICIARAPMALAQAGLTFALAKDGHHTKRKKIEFHRAKKISISFEKSLPVQIDGEKMETLMFDVSCIRQFLCVLRTEKAR